MCYTISRFKRGVNSVGSSPKKLKEFVLNLPQIVPQSWCSECRICCRFPDTEQVQTPFWSSMETGWANENKPEAGAWFKKEENSPSLAPQLVSCGGSGYRCPAFEAKTNLCTIHEVKPLDCRLYPFVLSTNPGRTEALLAMDPKCPFIEKNPADPELLAYASQLAEYLDTETGVEYLRQNPKVVGPAWPEYLWVAALPRSTAWIQVPEEIKAPQPSLRSVLPENLPLLRQALGQRPHSASHYTLAALLGWNDLIKLWWVPLENGLGLFAEQAGGFFMPVPPIGAELRPEAVLQAWKILEEANQGSAVSRIEGIEASEAPVFERAGFILELGESEYVYSVADLARLRGDRYHSQRGAVNRSAKSISYQIRPFEGKDLVPCLQLYTRWAIRRQRSGADDMERRMLRDSLFFHRRLMTDADTLGLAGRVLESEGRILAYTFGGPVSKEMFCVFAEIAENTPPGLAQTIFREFCREMEEQGYKEVNCMGDAGIPSLRRAKLAYRPVREEQVFTALKKN